MPPTLDQQATLHHNVNADKRNYMMHACVHRDLPFIIADAFLTSVDTTVDSHDMTHPQYRLLQS